LSEPGSTDVSGGPISAERSAKRRRLSGGGYLITGLTVGALSLLTGFVALPILSLVIWTVSNSAWQEMMSPAAVDALLLSARTTGISMIIILLVGTPAAYVLARYDFPGKRIVNTLVDLPAVLPPSAAGIALLLAFGRVGLLGEQLTALGITVSFTTAAVVLAELFVATHFYVRQAAVGFGQIDRGIEEAALVDGGGPITVFVRVTMPLAFPALMAGAVTAWARALGEFGGTIIFAGNVQGVTQTIPLAIFSELERDFDAAVALSVLVLGFAFAVILTARYLTGKAAEIRE
jgi:molybdate transport system permease protein